MSEHSDQQKHEPGDAVPADAGAGGDTAGAATNAPGDAASSESEASSSGDPGDFTSAADNLRETIASAAEQLGAREALAQLAGRARTIVQELAEGARQREAAAAREAAARDAARSREQAAAATAARGRSAESPLEATLPELHRRLGELRACVGEVADVLEGTVERLETVELQLGNADASVEQHLAAGIERCERVLAGIEQRIRRRVEEAQPQVRPSPRTAVLVVARSSERRAALCLALERQGLHAVAAVDARGAAHATRRRPAAVALLVAEGDVEEQALAIERWDEGRRLGDLPPAVLLVPGAGAEASARAAAGFEIPGIVEDHGEAAMAASLLALLVPDA